jgi:hypothetical protein
MFERRPRGARWLVFASVLAWCAVAVAGAQADEAESIYQPSSIGYIELTLPPTSESELNAEPDKDVPATFTYATTDGTPGGIGAKSASYNVEVHLKGSSSFRTLAGKAAWKVKFKKTERFLGLKKMTLNNMVEDASMTHETLAYEAFHAAGVPGSRTGFAYLVVNGHDYGVYLNIETLDGQMMERIFGSFDADTQHLYEGEDGADVSAAEWHLLEVSEGSETDLSDLEALVAAVNGTGSTPWSARVAATADLEEMTKMWAVEKYVGQWDGYSGQEGSFWPNNYYLLSDPAGRFQMLPWGTDETFEVPRGQIAFDAHAGVLFNHCLEDPTCAAMYWHAVAAARTTFASIDPEAVVTQTAALLKPWQEREQNDSRHEFSMSEITAAQAQTRTFIAARPAQAATWLAAHEPPAEEPPKEPPAEEPPPKEPPVVTPPSVQPPALLTAATPLTPPALAPAVATVAGKRLRLTAERRPTVSFAAESPGATFECRVDERPFRVCASPFRLPRLTVGIHRFEILAVNAAGAGPVAVAKIRVKRTART